MCQTTLQCRKPELQIGEGRCSWVFGNDASRDMLLSDSPAGLKIEVMTKAGLVREFYLVSRCNEGWQLTKENKDGSLGDRRIVDTTFDEDPGLWTCNCKDALYRGQRCKHKRALTNALKTIGIVKV